jgi:uncharacterized membrane protein
MTRLTAISLTAGAIAWAAVLIATPFVLRSADAPVVRGLVFGIGGVICHQRPERSFHLHGTQLPVCARCTGLYLSGAAGAALGWLGLAAVPRRTRALVLAAAVPTVVTVVLEWAGAAAPTNAIRAAAALPLGGAAGWLFVRMLRAESSASTCATIA